MEDKEQQKHVIVCHKTPGINMARQDGGLEHLMGAHNIQVMRCCRKNGDYTYNHAPMLAVWQNKLILSYISGKKDEHKPPVHIVFTTSADGNDWAKERELFPFLYADTEPYCGPAKELLSTKAPCILHHRMSFYKSQSGRMYVCAFYGLSPDGHIAPNNGYGIARLVREIYSDYTLSPLYVLKYNWAAGFNIDNTRFYTMNENLVYFDVPYYKVCGDDCFVSACEEMLSSKRVTLQWFEEEKFDPSQEVVGKAVSIYQAADGKYVGLCKMGEGYLWDEQMKLIMSEKVPTLITATGKVWGQKTPQDNYLICYNPTADGGHRWPLAVMTGKLGRDFYDMKTLLPEIPPYRYEGGMKNLGAQYIRGICDYNIAETDKTVIGDKVWLTYSTNKEDIWVSYIDSSKEYSLTKHAWSKVEVKDGVWNVEDWDCCQRVIFEFKPRVGAMLMFVEVSDICVDNPVYVEIRIDGEIRETHECEKGKKYIHIPFGKYDKPYSIIVYSKKYLKLNTTAEDGRHSELQDMICADDECKLSKYSFGMITNRRRNE